MNDSVEIKPTGFSFDSLEAVRRKLLDLTARNSLLAYKHPRASCVRLIDELPNQIMESLQNGETLTFIPVPEPTEKQLLTAGYIKINPETGNKELSEYPTAVQWAKHIGLNIQYDLPEKETIQQGESKHNDSNLQTLLYAPELEARLRSIKGKADSAIEECGSNILYLVVGFLEWFESTDSDLRRHAPLFTLPLLIKRAQLDTDKGVYRYTIELKDEGILTNVTLQQKMEMDFGLLLPSIEEGILPEDYFELISTTILKHKPNWSIKRNITLALLDFAKQAMYQDLDPTKWPASGNIQNHSIIQKFFSSTNSDEERSNTNYASEHNIDSVPNIHQYFPLIYDADSSQHSAVIDATNGESLVIEGPPGSGKSQTITNIIAACIANGKSVLFVAEKMAALNVVKDRLDKAGLGDFCLELHSHKTNKLQILNSLSLRLANQDTYAHPRSIDLEILSLEDLKRKLNEYVQLINSPWKNTDITLHDIFNRAARYREELKIDAEKLRIPDLNGESLTIVRQKNLFDQADMLKDIYVQVSQQAINENILEHYWYGINNTELTIQTCESLIRHLRNWNDLLIKFNQEWISKASELSLDGSELDFDSAMSFLEAIEGLPDLIGDEPMLKLDFFKDNRSAITEFVDIYSGIFDNLKQLTRIFKPECIFEPNQFSAISSALEGLNRLGIPKTITLGELHQDYNRLKNCYESGNSIQHKLDDIRTKLPASLHTICNLSRNGIEEFKNCTQLLKKLPPDLWRLRDDLFGNPDLDSLIVVLKPKLQSLKNLHNQLADVFKLENLPSASELHKSKSILDNSTFFSFFSSDWRQAKKSILALAKSPKEKTKVLLEFLPLLLEFSKGINEVEEINRSENLLGGLYDGINTPMEKISMLRNWYKAIRQEYGVGFGTRVGIGTAIISLDRELASALVNVGEKEIISEGANLLDEIKYQQTRFAEFGSFFEPNSTFGGSESVLKKLLLSLKPTLVTIGNATVSTGISIQDIDSAIDSLSVFHKRIKQWNEHPVQNALVPKYLNVTLSDFKYNEAFVRLTRNMILISEKVSSNEVLWNLFSHSESPIDQYHAVRKIAADLNVQSQSTRQSRDQFFAVGKVDGKEWTASSSSRIENVIQKNARALSEPIWLNTWLDYIRIRKKLASNGLDAIVLGLESRVIHAGDLSQILNLVIYDQLAKEALEENSSLGLFSGLEQMAIRNKYREYDRLLLDLQRKKIAYAASRNTPPFGNSSGKVSTYTETSLIRHEASKKTRHISIRSLLSAAGTSIKILKPCFMMSPMSVAQYLKPGDFNFDLVIMDEASQIKPEDSLGAIARGKAVVIVGDPKQLPPTSFFQKNVDSEDSEDNVALEESESILDTVVPMFKNRRLRWHYRSRHQSLIAFSNKHFYDDNLILFPSPIQKSTEFGIKFHRVVKGKFVSRRNIEEAKVIVEYVGKHFKQCHDESIGVVAMSAEQRDEIERQFEQLIKDDPEVRAAFDSNAISHDPLFIKNLENVQGDERDVMVISMTYGPEQIGGRTMQRFGPINSDSGWRRLNVLFTRSKKRMHVFSSMSSSDVILSPTSKRGVKSLRAFIEYCETGNLHNIQLTGKSADSDFEIAVMRALQNHGYECEPQLGAAGFFLDLAVKDPGNPGKFLLGIECDGATYHSAKSARDRDRLRQEILEGLGWKIRRIWSTDWFKNPHAQLQPILNDLERLRTPEGESIANLEEIFTISEKIDSPSADVEIETAGSESNTLQGNMTLKERLQHLNDTVIKIEFKDTPDELRLLRPSMIEALLIHKPGSKAEFFESIPDYIRKGTSPSEGKYLDTVLNIISEYDEVSAD